MTHLNDIIQEDHAEAIQIVESKVAACNTGAY